MYKLQTRSAHWRFTGKSIRSIVGCSPRRGASYKLCGFGASGFEFVLAGVEPGFTNTIYINNQTPTGKRLTCDLRWQLRELVGLPHDIDLSPNQTQAYFTLNELYNFIYDGHLWHAVDL